MVTAAPVASWHVTVQPVASSENQSCNARGAPTDPSARSTPAQVDTDVSCIRLGRERANHVWAYGFVEDRTHDRRKSGLLRVVDRVPREARAIKVNRKLGSAKVPKTQTELMLERGAREQTRSDNSSEFVAQAARDWIAAVGSKTAHLGPASPWETGGVENLNSKLRDKLLNRGIFCAPKNAQIMNQAWRRHTNAVEPHSAHRRAPPASEVRIPEPPVWPAMTPAH